MGAGEGVEGRCVIAEGREAVLYDWDDGLVLRLMRSQDAGTAVADSNAASEAARSAGVPTPRVVDVIEIDGRPAQILERIDGHDLFAYLAANPFRLPEVASTLAAVHVQLHQVAAPAELVSTNERLSRPLQESHLVPAAARRQALHALDRLPAGDAICHGDYHPGNVLLGDAGPVLIDWTGATRGDPTADFARTRLMLRVGELPPGSPAAVRALAAVGRRALWKLYDRDYRRARVVDLDLADRWTFVVAANRLTEGIESERPALLRTLRELAG